MEKQELAAALLAAAQGGTRPAPAAAEALNEAEAYAAQDALLNAWKEQGTGCAGYKIALTSPALQERFGVAEPAYGYVLDTACLATGAEFTIPEGAAVRVECELALVMGRDVPSLPDGREDLLSYVAYGLPALEIVSSRYDAPHTSTSCLIADNSNFMAAVLGDVPVRIDGLDTSLLGLRLEVNGKLRVSGVSAAVLGDPLNALDWLIRKLHSQGKALKKGDIVLTGSFIASEPAQPGEYFRADIDALGSAAIRFVAPAKPEA